MQLTQTVDKMQLEVGLSFMRVTTLPFYDTKFASSGQYFYHWRSQDSRVAAPAENGDVFGFRCYLL